MENMIFGLETYLYCGNSLDKSFSKKGAVGELTIVTYKMNCERSPHCAILIDVFVSKVKP